MIKYKKIQEKINKRIDTLTKNYKKSYDYYLNELKENYPKKKETGKEEYEFKKIESNNNNKFEDVLPQINPARDSGTK